MSDYFCQAVILSNPKKRSSMNGSIDLHLDVEAAGSFSNYGLSHLIVNVEKNKLDEAIALLNHGTIISFWRKANKHSRFDAPHRLPAMSADYSRLIVIDNIRLDLIGELEYVFS